MLSYRSGLLVGALIVLGGCGGNTENRGQEYRKQQAIDLVASYEQARSQGDLLSTCVKSNQVSAAYRDAKNTADADAWKAKAAVDCGAARDKFAPGIQGNKPDGR